MQPTQTGIAVALALVVVAAFFIFPGLWPFGNASALKSAEATTTTATLPTTNTQTSPSTMDLTAQPTDKLEVTDEAVGTGAVAEKGDTVVVEYTGALTDGTVFDSSVGKGPIDQITPCPADATTGLCFILGGGQVIPGWDQGVAGMKVGGERKLVIPPALGYGARGAGSAIPPNATLVFQVKLLGVQKGQ